MIKTITALCLIGIALAQNHHHPNNVHPDQVHDKCDINAISCQCHDGRMGTCIEEHGHTRCECGDLTAAVMAHQTCNTTADCPACDHGSMPYCNTHSDPPHCLCNHHAAKRGNGCTNDTDCADHCSHHPPGYCAHGHCNCHQPPVRRGNECGSDAECSSCPTGSGFCAHGHCNCHHTSVRAQDECTTNSDCSCTHGTAFCNTASNPNHCTCHKAKRGNECTNDTDCADHCSHHPPGYCAHGHCNCHQPPVRRGNECGSDAECSSCPTGSGFCAHGHCNCHHTLARAQQCDPSTCNANCPHHGFCDIHNHCQCTNH